MKNKKLFTQILLPFGLAIVVFVGFYLLYTISRGQETTIRHPETGQCMLANELVVLTSGQDINEIIKEHNGEITVSVPQTDSYQVRFPVSNLEELDKIKEEINKTGAKATYVYLISTLEGKSCR